MYERVITDDATERFNETHYKSDWVEKGTCGNRSESYSLFFKKFLTIQENFLPRQRIKLKVKVIQRSNITSDIKKSSKRNQ